MVSAVLRSCIILPCLAILIFPVSASELDAVRISANIKAIHLPFGTILDPIFASPTSSQITGYTRCGDSALWTGTYLAAESFRYKVTHSADALDDVKTALAGLESLTEVTGDNRLARCMVRADSPYAAGIASEEAHNTIHQNPPWIWVDNTSRDQVVGAFFGLGAAYDLVDDNSVTNRISDLATMLLEFVAKHQWSPNDNISNTFQLRPEELQMLVQVTRHVNPQVSISRPPIVLPVNVGASFDVLSIGSYFKFNLDYMSFYHLIRLQDNADNRAAYKIVRDYTASHQNAFFDMIDRAINGPDSARDSEAANLLDQWLKRSRRDEFVDDTKVVTNCGTEACEPVPVPIRPPTDFLWQRDPFQLSGGGSGLVESAGVDYILPYWMARYFGVVSGAAVQSAAAPSIVIAPGSLASLYGTNLATKIATASSQPLPLTLGDARLAVTDAAGIERAAPLLYVSPTQINFLVPDGTAPGAAKLVVTGATASQTFSATVGAIAPLLFSLDGTGGGLAAASAIQTQANDPALQTPIPVYTCTGSSCVPVPIDLSEDTDTYLTLYGTGIRNRGVLENVTATVAGTAAPVNYAGPTPGFTGLDQVNVLLPLSLRGAGQIGVSITVDGEASNVVQIDIK